MFIKNLARQLRYAAFGLAALSVTICGAAAQMPPGHDQIIEIEYTLDPEEVITFVFVGFGGVTQESVGDPDGDGVICITVPPGTTGALYVGEVGEVGELGEDSWLAIVSALLGPDSAPSVGGTVPMIADSTGLPLLPNFVLEDLDQMPPLLVGQSFEVVNGMSSEYRIAEIRAPGLPFDQILLQEWGDLENFPLFTGTAFVTNLVDTTVRTSCPWDLDGDGIVGGGDLLLLLASWGDPYGAADLLDVLAAWGACP